MKIEFHKWYSPSINKEMRMKVYGHYGQPFLVFPCAGGDFKEFEGFGMISLLSRYIEEGRIKVFTVDSLDNESWLNEGAENWYKGKRHNDYDRYIINEVVPFIYNHCGGKIGIMSTGCSLGGYHCVNFYLRHPEVFSGTIALSGVYSLKHFVGNYMDDSIYYNSPVDYLPNLNDHKILSNINNGRLIICSGQGAWEETGLSDLLRLRDIMSYKKIKYWIDLWGYDVNHDWPWWKKQLPYFMDKVL